MAHLRRRWATGHGPLEGEGQPTVEPVVRGLRRMPLASLLVSALINSFSARSEG